MKEGNMRRSFKVAAHLGLAMLWAASRFAIADGNPERGARVFQVCTACHSTRPGEHLTGPSLAGVWGRKAGTAQGFHRYSDAMKRSGVTWNASTLDKWLANPDGFIHGTAMMFAGLRKAQDREDAIAYLKA